MDKRAESVYLSEIGTQCSYGILAAAEFEAALQDAASAETIGVSFASAFRNAHSFLTHASNVSKLLWPPRPLRRRDEDKALYAARCALTDERGAYLRAMLKVRSDSPVASRELRNHLDHFDERIDEWAQGARQYWIDTNIGPTSQAIEFGVEHVMRWIDPAAGTMIFRGAVHSIHEQEAALRTVSQAADARLKALKAPMDS